LCFLIIGIELCFGENMNDSEGLSEEDIGNVVGLNFTVQAMPNSEDGTDEYEEDGEVHLCDDCREETTRTEEAISRMLDAVMQQVPPEEPENKERDAIRQIAKMFILDIYSENLDAAKELMPMLQNYQDCVKPWARGIFHKLHQVLNQTGKNHCNPHLATEFFKLALTIQSWLVSYLTSSF